MIAFAHARTALACVALIASCANAADTDRNPAGSPSDCAVPADLDGELVRTYERAVHALSPDEAGRLRASQDGWRRALGASCANANVTVSPDQTPMASCIEDAMQSRIDELGQLGLHAGALVLTRGERDSTSPEPPDPLQTLQPPRLLETHDAYPQIDAPASSAEREWNRAMALEPLVPQSSEGRSDLDRDYVVGCASPRVLSVRFSTYEFPHGAAHGWTTKKTRNFVLLPTIRPMTPDDLFASGSAWADKLSELLWQAYLDDGGQFAMDPKFEANVRAAAAKPDHWLLTPQGLQVAFSSYEAGCYACGPGPLTIPWARLAPLLVPDARPVCEAASDDPD
jgi:uncharacterized protein YecT (DUF1311 family)